MTTASRAMEQLVGWPDLSEAQPSCGTGRALRSVRADIAHFHSDQSVDLHLTATAIRRFEDDLKNSTAIRLVPGSHWVSIRLECDSDIHLLMTLVSLALKAHQGWPDTDREPPARCNDQHDLVSARDHARAD